jgi:hypothetical protein
VTTYRKLKDREKQLEETKGWYASGFLVPGMKLLESDMLFCLANVIALQKENANDPDMAEMIDAELESLSNQHVELEENLKVI